MSIYRSDLPSVDVPDVDIASYVFAHAGVRGDDVAWIDGPTGETTTYRAVDDAVRSLAGGLAARGVGPGTTWALMAPNGRDYAVVFHALVRCGATVTTLNPAYTAAEIAHQLADAGASAIVAQGALCSLAREAADLAGVPACWAIGEGGDADVLALEGPSLSFPPSVAPQTHVAALPYSSGTTGFPKGVMLTHRNLVANLRQIEDALVIDGSDVVYAALPFFHIYGMQILMNASLRHGATVVSVPRFDLETMLRLVETHRITRLFLVPPIVLALAKHPMVDRFDVSSVKQIFSGAAPLGADVAEAAAARMGCTIRQGYGMTELSPVTHTLRDDDPCPGSVGTLVADTEMRLVDPETQADVPLGERGEVWVRGPQVMKGYLNNPEATAQTVDGEGWLHTGDIGVVDAQGHLFIVDRLKELIKVKGFQVAPAELEALLLTHDGIADAAVIGVPDDASGEVPLACLVAAGERPLDADVRRFVADQVATYKQLGPIRWMDAIPKSASGKILRRVLREALRSGGDDDARA